MSKKKHNRGASQAFLTGQTNVFVCPHGCNPENAHRVVANVYKHKDGGREIVCTLCKKTISYIVTVK